MAMNSRSATPPAGVVDLRSDTVTRPTPEMRRAMAEAEVGDDVYSEDPTVNRLEHEAAEIFGKEAALFVPTGCMGNLIAIKIWTHHGDEVICDERGHVDLYELASMSAIAGCMPRIARGEDGILSWAADRSGDSPAHLLRFANRAGVPGKYAQHGGWYGVSDRAGGGHLRARARGQSESAHGWRARFLTPRSR